MLRMPALVALVGLFGAPPSQIVSTSQVTLGLFQARQVVVTSYTLDQRTAFTRALLARCTRGGVDVVFPNPRHVVGADLQQRNKRVLQRLHAAGCSTHETAAEQPLHMKLVELDGVPYIADRNWTRDATVIRIDRPEDRKLLVATINGTPAGNDHFATRKDLALDLEAASINASRGTLAVESESFGPDNPTYAAIVTALKAGRSVGLIVAEREYHHVPADAAAIRYLIELGAKVRIGSTNAKLAVADDGAAWIGSTNASPGVPNQIDTGLRIDDESTRAALRSRWLADWSAASPLS